MYQSRSSIDAKLAELRVLAAHLFRFRGRFFARFGLDEATSTHPVRIALSNFIAQARSIIQYANKEARERGLLARYDAAVAARPVFGLFKDLRDSEIHAFPPQVSACVSFQAAITAFDRDTGVAALRPMVLNVESLGDLDKPVGPGPDAHVEHHVSVQIPVTPDLIQTLRDRGEHDVADAAAAGEPLHVVVELDGVKDIFQLCERYLSDIDSFVELGVREGFIT